MKGSAGRARLRMLFRQRKKNGGSDPPGSCARSRPTVARHLQRPAQDRASGSGSRRDGGALGYAPSGCGSVNRTAAVPNPGCWPAHPSLSVRPTGSLSGTALQAGGDRCGPGGSFASLLLCVRTALLASSPPMSNWTSNTRSSLPACGACRPWWAKRLPSITDASR